MSDRGSEHQPAGPDELFVTLLTRDHARLMGYIRTLVTHRQDAEDLYQKISLTLWKKFPEFDRNLEFFPWAAQIAFFTVCNHRRSVYRSKLTFSQELIELMSQERIPHLEQQGSRLDLLIDCLDHLGESDQRLLMQAYGKELSVKELADQMGKAVQTLYNRLAFLRRDLVECVSRKHEGQRA